MSGQSDIDAVNAAIAATASLAAATAAVPMPQMPQQAALAVASVQPTIATPPPPLPPTTAASAEKKNRIVLRRYVAQDEREHELLAAAAAVSVSDDHALDSSASATAASTSSSSATGSTPAKRRRGGGDRLNDHQRLEIIRLRRQENPPSLRKIAREFNVSDRSIRNVMLSADAIEKRNENVDIKFQLRTFRMAAPRFPEVEEKTFQWIQSLRKAQMNPTPTAIIEKAKTIALELGIAPTAFKASPGWFERFRKRRHLVDKRLSVGGDDSESKLSGLASGAGFSANGDTLVDDANSDAATSLLTAHLAAQQHQQHLMLLQSPHGLSGNSSSSSSINGASALEPPSIYDLLHSLVDFETKVRSFQRSQPVEHTRLQQCLANASVIRHDLLAVQASMQVRTMRGAMAPPKAPGVNAQPQQQQQQQQLHGLGDLA